jgi:16S rRNA (adenine1518-N6/adenine1519-N6)-dimethyltransferase
VKAKRSLGQNFLVDRSYRERIVRAANPVAGETIIEIGPGQGALTGDLLKTEAQILAVELDRELAEDLRKEFAGFDNFTLIESDALKVDYCSSIRPQSHARVVANLPYYISTPIIERLINARACITEMILMLQREVVDRLVAQPGGKDYGYFSIFTQFYCEVTRLFHVPPSAFRPSPKVYSSVVRLNVRKSPAVEVSSPDYFITVAQVIFAQRRKTLLNNLRAGAARLGLEKMSNFDAIEKSSGIDLGRRGETLTMNEIANLAMALGAPPGSAGL